MNAEASIDELLEVARQQDNICNAQRCKIKITLLGQLCSYCNRRYCFEHSMPEVHGCGQQARKDIRQTHLSTHDNVKPVYENSSISKDKRPYLERKLQDKIASKESQRKKKEK
jgi:ATP-dependent RNA/DNA helicase IGHMBP2